MSDKNKTGNTTPGAIGSAPIEPVDFTPVDGSTRKKPVRLNRALLASVVALLLATPVLYFLFFAQSIAVKSIPPSEEVSVSGGFILPLAERYLLLPGIYKLEMSHNGYYPLQQRIEVTADKGQEFEFTLEKLPDLLHITSSPVVDAEVTINGELAGRTPLDIELIPGAHYLQLSAPRYQPYTETLKIAGGGNELQIDRALKPAWAEVAIESIPAGAKILVDGEEQGETPTVLEVLEGEHEVAIKAAGHKTWKTHVEITAGQPIALPTATLEPADGLLLVKTRPGRANILVNSKFAGQSPIELNLAPGKTYRIEAFKPGYKNTIKTIPVESGKEQSIMLTLSASVGEVIVKTVPADASIAVNGSPGKLRDNKLALPASPQSITVSKEGYVSQTVSVTPKPGLVQEVNIRLKTEAQAEWDAIKPRITTSAGQQMILFRPARFTMGASRREPGRRANEVLREVQISRAWYLSTTEVTNKQFREYKSTHSSGRFESYSLNDDNQPAVRVSWADAARYCNWLSRKEGLQPAYSFSGDQLLRFDTAANGYRLPTEAEWAWAARNNGMGLLKYPWGSDFPPKDKQGNFADRSAASLLGRVIPGYDDGYAATAPVASYKANFSGMFDMGGNVAEWINDYYGQISLAGKSAVTDPTGPAEGTFHVIRDSGWRHGTVVELRLSFRDYGNKPRDDVGFRIARYAK
jgi:formylglycine-generating enzyme required for sulfatase activity